MSPLAAAVEQSIRARKLLSARQPILVAVSGGVDSMVLLHVLQELSPRFQWKLTVAHLNHQLRGRNSDLDADLVRQTAAKLNLRLRVQRADVRACARRYKLSIEMAARRLRHEFFARTAARLRIRQVALAHHADDQLEIFFLRLLRGSGSEGLAGMDWKNPSASDPRLTLVRPLLDQPKNALLDYAAAHQIKFREDATNRSLEIPRNRIRHHLLPILRTYQPALNRTVLRAMELVGAETDLIGSLAREWVQHRLTAKTKKPRGSSMVYEKLEFEQLPVALQRRVLQLQLLDLGVNPLFELIEELRAASPRPVCVGRSRKEAGAVPFSVIRDSQGLIRVQAATGETFSNEHIRIALRSKNGAVKFAGVRIGWSKQAYRRGGGSIRARAGLERFDADLVGMSILLRHWRPGDRFQPSGVAQPVKLQDLFVNARIPRPERHRLLVGATRTGEIFWVERLRIAERFKLTKKTNRCLQWRWQRF